MNICARAPWVSHPDVQAVCKAVVSGGGTVFFVGGCVRDALLGVEGADVDLSTDVLPEEVIRRATSAGLKAIPTGIEHGTVTIVSGGTGYEVTTFRQDVETDGRRAIVSFSRDIKADALRRDFTMNALYATPSGDIVDPLDGLEDCLARRVRFIEDAGTRIQEDYLRILRYFRFHAWYAPPLSGFDPDALSAISANSAGLETLSAERVGMEMRKLLAAPDPAPAIASMRQSGCLAHVLPGADDRYLAPVVHLEHELKLAPDPILRLAALGGDEVADRLRLSRIEQRHLSQVQEACALSAGPSELGYRYGSDTAKQALVLRAAFAEQPVPLEDLQSVSAGAEAIFPISARDLMPQFHGAALGERLRYLEGVWIASGFDLSREDLMTRD